MFRNRGVILVQIGLVYLLVIVIDADNANFSGSDNPSNKTQKLNLEVSPHRAGNYYSSVCVLFECSAIGVRKNFVFVFLLRG